MDLKNKLLAIQQELKAPKGRNNRFGGYYYRSTEDILTALKPLLKKQNVILTITDTVELIGDRYYVKATVCLEDTEADGRISTSAYARETLERKKSDDSQLTGAASSYARKYALNGLFLIDDTQDADTYGDDPEELDRQEAEEQEKPARKPRKMKKAEALTEDSFFYLEDENNVVMKRAGDVAPDGGQPITKEQFVAAGKEIAIKGEDADVKRALFEASDAMNIPEGVDEEAPFDTNTEEKPKTRRTRRKR